MRSHPLGRLRRGVALAVAATIVAVLAGCAPVGQQHILAEVKSAVQAADPGVTHVAVESGKDGLASVLFVVVAIPQTSIESDRLTTLLKAVVDTPGATGFTMLQFGVSTRDLRGDIVDISGPADELGIQTSDGDIDDDVTTVKKALG